MKLRSLYSTVLFAPALLAGTLIAVLAMSATAHGADGGDASLRLKLVEPLSGSPRVVIAGPGGFHRSVRSSVTLKKLPIGRYRIIAPVKRTRLWYSKPRVSKRSFRIGANTRRVTVSVSYWNTIYRKTKRAKKGADLGLKWTKSDQGILRTRAVYATGSIVASAPTEAAPEGYLVRVKRELQQSGGVNTYLVVRATLTEAVPRGSFTTEMSVPMDSARASAAQKKPLVSCSGQASASAEASVSGELPVDFDAHWSLFGDDSFTVTARPKVELRSKAVVQGSGSCKVDERVLWTHSMKPVVVWVGPVPVVIVPELSAAAGANMSVSASATAEAKVSLSGELKGEATSKGLSVSKQGPTLSRSASFSTEASGNVFAYGKAYFTGKIYGIAGPYVSLTLGPEFNANTNSNPWWTLGARVKGGIGVKVSALGIDKSKDDLYNGYFALMDAGGPFKGPAPKPQPPKGNGLGAIGDELTGSGISGSSNVNYIGNSEQFAKLDGLAAGEPTWVLTTGRVSEVNGAPSFFASTDFILPGHSLLSSLAGYETRDAGLFSLDVVPSGSTLKIRYVFASEEYPEFVGSQFNDVMAVLVDGSNCALVPGAGSAVAVNSINDETNSAFYIDNESGASGLNTVFDGVTVPLECTASVVPGQAVDVTFAVADASDGIYDSAVALPVNAISSE